MVMLLSQFKRATKNAITSYISQKPIQIEWLLQMIDKVYGINIAFVVSWWCIFCQETAVIVFPPRPVPPTHCHQTCHNIHLRWRTQKSTYHLLLLVIKNAITSVLDSEVQPTQYITIHCNTLQYISSSSTHSHKKCHTSQNHLQWSTPKKYHLHSLSLSLKSWYSLSWDVTFECYKFVTYLLDISKHICHIFVTYF